VRVYVWQWPVRATHWATAYAILFLAATGLYMGHPFIAVPGAAGQHFVMGWAKTIHFYTGHRVRPLRRLPRAVDVHGQPLRDLGQVHPHLPPAPPGAVGQACGTTCFQLRQPPGFVGHNPLAGFTYTFVFLLYFVMITTGLALYNVNAPLGSPFRAFHFLLPLWGGAQTARASCTTSRCGSSWASPSTTSTARC